MRAVALAIAVVLMAACVKPASHASPLVPGSAGRPVYVGPMYVPFSIDQEAAVPERSGAAGKALECRYPHFSGVAYLQVGPTTRARFYVRDAGGILTKYLLVPYDGAATLR